MRNGEISAKRSTDQRADSSEDHCTTSACNRSVSSGDGSHDCARAPANGRSDRCIRGLAVLQANFANLRAGVLPLVRNRANRRSDVRSAD